MYAGLTRAHPQSPILFSVLEPTLIIIAVNLVNLWMVPQLLHCRICQTLVSCSSFDQPLALLLTSEMTALLFREQTHSGRVTSLFQ